MNKVAVQSAVVLLCAMVIRESDIVVFAEHDQFVSFLLMEIVNADDDFSKMVLLMEFSKVLWRAEHAEPIAEAMTVAWVAVDETDDFFLAGTVDTDRGGVDIHTPFRADSVEERRYDGGFVRIICGDMLFNKRYSQRMEQHAFTDDGGVGHADGRCEFAKSEGVELEDGIENAGYGECDDDDEKQAEVFFRGRIIP